MTSKHTCDRCHNPFTPSPHNPAQRFCSDTCRKAWHRRHRTAARRDVVPDDERRRVTQDAANVVTDDGITSATSANNDAVPLVTKTTTLVPNVPNTANGEQRCPHCREPIAIVALLVPPQAAVVRTPEVTTRTR